MLKYGAKLIKLGLISYPDNVHYEIQIRRYMYAFLIAFIYMLCLYVCNFFQWYRNANIIYIVYIFERHRDKVIKS